MDSSSTQMIIKKNKIDKIWFGNSDLYALRLF